MGSDKQLRDRWTSPLKRDHHTNTEKERETVREMELSSRVDEKP